MADIPSCYDCAHFRRAEFEAYNDGHCAKVLVRMDDPAYWIHGSNFRHADVCEARNGPCGENGSMFEQASRLERLNRFVHEGWPIALLYLLSMGGVVVWVLKDLIP